MKKTSNISTLSYMMFFTGALSTASFTASASQAPAIGVISVVDQDEYQSAKDAWLAAGKKKIKTKDAATEAAPGKEMKEPAKAEPGPAKAEPAPQKAKVIKKKKVIKSDAKKTKESPKGNAETEEIDQWGPWKYYLSLSLDDDLDPEVEDNMIMMWVLAAVIPQVISVSAPFVAFLIPKFLGDPGPGFYGDIMVSMGAGWAVSTVAELVLVVLLLSGICTPVGYVGLIGWSVFASMYWKPVIMLNMYNRSVKRRKRGEQHPLSDHEYELPFGGDDEEASAKDVLEEHLKGPRYGSLDPAMMY